MTKSPLLYRKMVKNEMIDALKSDQKPTFFDQKPTFKNGFDHEKPSIYAALRAFWSNAHFFS